MSTITSSSQLAQSDLSFLQANHPVPQHTGLVPVPSSGVALNDLVLDVMTVAGNERRGEMAHFLASGRTVQNELMAEALRGTIVNASA